MKKVIIFCSISSSSEVIGVRDKLLQMGFSVEIPLGVQQYIDNGYTLKSKVERFEDKKNLDLISRYYEKIKENDMALVVNIEKNGVPGYIGGNTFLEMGFAHVLKKPIYVLNPLPECSYSDELLALNTEIINGDLSKLK
jgi:hypothetical protein